ncbi:MAG TPA: hypothetical protein VFP84_24370 [Kofleriaceae bacterium]|nr:hypothetical protein [Kofleriaceae bacterium]
MTRWWFAPAPAERLAALRIAIGAFATVWLAARLPELWSLAHLSAHELAPVGVVRVVSAPLPVPVVLAIAVASVACLVAFTVGWRYRITAPLAALGLLWTLSYRNAWGMVFHTDNLLVLHVIALACAPAADAWAVDRPRPAPPAGHGWPIKLLATLTVATYLLAGIAKLRLGGWAWVGGEQLRNQIAIDNLRKALLGSMVAPFARVLVAHPDALAGFALGTVAIELGAPLALIGRRAGAVWAAAAWSFHVGVVLTMNVWFPYPLIGVAFLPLLEAERIALWLKARWRNAPSTPARSPGAA